MHQGGTRAIPVLIEALGSDDPQVRLRAANVLGGIGADAVPSLIDSLGNPNPVIRIGAARAIQRIGPNATDAIPALQRALSDDEPLVVSMCIAALGRTGMPAVPILVELFQMRGKRNEVRLAALEALGIIGLDAIEASSVVLKAAKEEDDPIAERAADTLKKIDPETAARNGFD
jgi:HEAT repeat protein